MADYIERFKERISSYPQEEQKRLLAAADLSEKLHEGQFRQSGEPYVTHPIAVAEILIDLNLDSDTLVAALLHDALEDTSITREELRKQFGKNVEMLVNGVTKIAMVKAKNRSTQAAETIRKMLFAMSKDIRVILIKLADKLHNMRTLEFKRGPRAQEIAQECLDIYAPLAGRLGISWLKDELEDLSLKHLHPEVYQQLKNFVAQKRSERGEYLKQVEDAIRSVAEREQIPAQVETRAKHFYSIYEKMRRRNKSLDEIYDLLGLRILVDSETQCYTMLGIVHRLWMPIEGRFKDYIAMPKSNRYQSLHTTVMGPRGRLTEIQIRTHEMHRVAEFGVAAHWLYKSTADASDAHRNLAIMNRVRNLGNVRITSNEFLEEIKREILKDSIYVFTPKGDVIHLPRGSTPIDFAYHIHTEVGHRCIGAKADGHIIPLKDPLGNTQVVEILTNRNARPHLSWLRFVRTTRARQKIRHWLNNHDENLFIDQSVVARHKSDRTQPTPVQQRKKPQTSSETPEDASPETVMDREKVGVRIGNERNMMIRFANCCKPETGDDIVGYVSRGRGIIVHTRDCKNLRSIPDLNDRTIEVEWETVSPHITLRYEITAESARDLFSEIEGAVRKFKGHLIEGKVDEMVNGRIRAHFTLEMERREDTRKIMKSIRAIPAVLNIREAPESYATEIPKR